MAQQHLLVFRFSSLGDVAMTVPVLQQALEQNPKLKITYVSTAFVKPLFDGLPRLRFVAADLKVQHKGVRGLYRLFRELKADTKFTGIADLHNVLRTKVLRGYFLATGIPAAALDKGRDEKKELTRPENKLLRPLKPMHQRYADVFTELGVAIDLEKPYRFRTAPVPPLLAEGKASGKRFVGIAPFAAFKEKTYPAEKMSGVIQLLLADPKIEILLFGGKADRTVFNAHWGSLERVHNMAGTMSFEEELAHIASLDVMVSMDSANMHLASLFGVPVVSVWGGTHPWLGFYGWRQNPANAVQIALSCRPSSVFGNKDCPNDLACMHGIAPLMVADKIFQVIDQRS